MRCRFLNIFSKEGTRFFMQLAVGSIVEGKVTGITKFGAFVELPGGKTGMVHISEVARAYVNEIRDYVTENQLVKVKVLKIQDDGKISLSIKQAAEKPAPSGKKQDGTSRPRYSGKPDQIDFNNKKKNENLSFEDMLTKFKQTSDDKMSDLKKYNEGKHPNRRGFSKSLRLSFVVFCF